MSEVPIHKRVFFCEHWSGEQSRAATISHIESVIGTCLSLDEQRQLEKMETGEEVHIADGWAGIQRWQRIR